MRVVDGGQLQFAGADVFPNIGFGPVGDGEDADVFAGHLAAVVQVPQLGALAAGIPAAEGIADGEDAFLGAGALLVAAGATAHGVIFALGDGLYQRHGLQRVAGAIGALLQVAAVDPVLDAGDVEASAGFFHEAVAEIDDLREVVAGIDMEQLKRHRGRGEGAAG